MTVGAAFYQGEVVHERFRPKKHKLRYRVFSMLMDIAELPRLKEYSLFFGYNRWAPLSFFDCDHGPRDGTSLRAWAQETMRNAGIEFDEGPIELLCYPRIFGYVFNPLSVYFCRRRNGDLAAVLYEVHNTHGEQHTYAMPVVRAGSVIRQSAEKAFFVSPFIGPTATYHFRIVPPNETTSIVIRQEIGSELIMAASFRGNRIPFTTKTTLRTLCMFPLMTVKIFAAIHWEAFKLWRKGFKIFPHLPQQANR